MSRSIILTAASLMLIASPAFAGAGALTLVVGGEAYDGPPQFEVSFNGKVVGEGTVQSAIDTANAGRFAEAKSKSAYLQSFDFPIPDALFSPTAFVKVRFLNEANGGPGSALDRNLYVFSVAVNGKAVPASELTTVGAQGRVPSPMLGEYLALLDDSTSAVAAAPAGGWPEARLQPAVAEVTQASSPASAAAVTAAAPQKMTLPVAAAPAPAPTVPATPKPAAAEVAAIDPTTTGATGKGAAAQTDCTLDQLYNVIGFNENSNDLTPKLKTRLDQILADIGDNQCVVQVVGYSSTIGDYATNALFAVERAQNVLTYLKAKGLHVAKSMATGAGETTQFGDDPLKNRRVVVTVSP